MKETINNEQKQYHCSMLMEELKSKVQMLKDYGMSEMEIVSRLHSSRPLMRLVISRDYRLYIGETHNEVHLEPIVKAVYVLFLKHPEGISFKSLPDYREELTRIYKRLKPYGLTERAKNSIADVINPLSNSINEKCSRIKAAFTKKVDGTIVEQYIITGERGESKRIVLPREFVVWE